MPSSSECAGMKPVESRNAGFQCARAAIAEAGEVVGSQSVAIPQRGGRRARVAEVQLRSGSIILQPPKRFGSQTKGLELNYVLASEAESDSDSSGLNWLLVTSEPVVEEELLSGTSSNVSHALQSQLASVGRIQLCARARGSHT